MATHSELELSFTASGSEQTPFRKQKTSVRKLQLAPHGYVSLTDTDSEGVPVLSKRP